MAVATMGGERARVRSLPTDDDRCCERGESESRGSRLRLSHGDWEEGWSRTRRRDPDRRPDETVARLRKLLDRYERRRGGLRRRGRGCVATGLAALDRALPGGGLPSGSLIEVLSGGSGNGAWTLALRTAVHAAGGVNGEIDGRACEATKSKSVTNSTPSKLTVLVDCDGDFYPPAAAALGISLDRLLVVRVRNAAEAFWATEQSLCCGGVSAVVATRLVLDEVRSRKLQLAAERSGGLGLVLSPAAARGNGFAAVRLLVEPAPPVRVEGSSSVSRFTAARRLRITVLKVRSAGRRWEDSCEPIVTGWCDEAFDVPVRSVSADRAAAERLQRVSA